jgi:protoporphyrin/coproporphyrin ferrochelatase
MQQPIGILLVNLGTPDSPQVPDVRKYLKEFLLDERVIDIPDVQRNLLVRGIIAPFRAPKSAKTYKVIWTNEGSPLLVYSYRLQEKLQAALGNDYVVELAMRYQKPSIASGLAALKDKNCKSIQVIPLFPQYASATNASVIQKVMEIVSKWQAIPEISFVSSFHDHPLFIKAFAEIGKKHQPETYDHILFSYHGLPERQILKTVEGNNCLTENCCDTLHPRNCFCYRAQCFNTTRLIASTLNLSPENYTVCFQSRLGKTPWIKPYTTEILKKLAKEGKKRLLVFSPAFVADCLETVYEISVEYHEEFRELGGEHVQLVESLNDSPIFVDCLVDLIKE